MIPGRKHARESLGNVLVLGLGVSGRAVVEYLAPMVGGRVESLTVLGGGATDEALAWARGLEERRAGSGVRFEFGLEDAEKAIPEGAERFDVCIASPGISAFSDFYLSAKAASNAVIGEVELAWCESPADSVWVAVTGTNGKTTTTSLIEHVLNASGFDAKAVGNIGDACITEVARDLEAGIPRHYVVETSSYQLASVNEFAPNVAVLLGITPDHIKWHRTHQHYAASKMRLLRNLPSVPGSVAVLDATNDEVRAKVRELKAEGRQARGFDYVPIGTSVGIEGDMRKACGADNAAFLSDGELTVALGGAEHSLGPASGLSILGEHNVVNALAAAAACLACGAKADSVASSLAAFAPLEHRIEPCGVRGGASYYNDSKATNVDATLQALKAFLPKKPIVMLGGDDKGTDLAELVASCRENAKALVCYGEAGQRFYDALAPLAREGVEVAIVPGFQQAFEWASSHAGDGDVVLLSPACASFDEFSCFEERGERFKELVGKLEG